MFIREKLASNINLIAEKLPNFHSVTVGMWVRAGSVTESAAENGLSHFIEHMLFKGTEKRTAKQIAVDVDNIGGQMNAFTSKELTCYYIKTIDEKLEEGIEILADLFCNAQLDEGELNKERGVILEEIAMNNDDPEDVAMDLIASTFFKGCPLDKTILGPPENIKGYSRKDLVAYMDKHYTAENMIISVAGNFDEARLRDALNKYVKVKHADKSAPGAVDCSAFKAGKGFDCIEKDVEQMHICMALPSYSMKSGMRYPIYVLNNVIGGSMSSRLFQKIREEMGMAYSVYSHPVMYSDTGMYSLYAGTMAQNAEKVAALMVEELRNVKAHGITKDEFLQSKEQLKGNLILSLESTSSKMNAIGKSALLTDTVYSDEEIIEMVSAVTMDDVARVIDEIIKPDDVTATYVGKLADKNALRAVTNG